MGFLIDAQLPPALARWLEGQGFQAEHVAEAERLHAPDLEIGKYAVENGAALITKDEDFAVWRNATSGADPAVIWVRIGNSRKADLLRRMEAAWLRVIAAIEQGEHLIELK